MREHTPGLSKVALTQPTSSFPRIEKSADRLELGDVDTLDLLPAVDVQGGQAVQLVQGVATLHIDSGQ